MAVTCLCAATGFSGFTGCEHGGIVDRRDLRKFVVMVWRFPLVNFDCGTAEVEAIGDSMGIFDSLTAPPRSDSARVVAAIDLRLAVCMVLRF